MTTLLIAILAIGLIYLLIKIFIGITKITLLVLAALLVLVVIAVLLGGPDFVCSAGRIP